MALFYGRRLSITAGFIEAGPETKHNQGDLTVVIVAVSENEIIQISVTASFISGPFFFQNLAQ
jgi:hypothetical protein